MKLVRKNPLFGVFVIPLIADIFLTVLGQPNQYWTTHYKVFSEAVPVYPLLQIHPLLFIFTSLATWLPITYLLTKKLRKPFDLWAAAALLIGHSYNSISWLRTIQNNIGLFAERDQLNLALGLIPMTIYIIIIGYFASKYLLIYFSFKK